VKVDAIYALSVLGSDWHRNTPVTERAGLAR